MKNKVMRALVLALLLAMMGAHGALADKVVETDEEAVRHAEHLRTHEAGTVFTCTGDYVRIRIKPASIKICGRMLTGEEFVILDSYKNWVRIEIINATPDNPDSRRGMIGWVDAAYISCGCETETYAVKTESDAAE